jgi:hypothetical protein
MRLRLLCTSIVWILSGCDMPMRVPATTAPSTMILGPSRTPQGNRHPQLWRYQMELVSQTSGQICERDLRDPGRPYQGVVHVRVDGATFAIGCFDGDELTFGICIHAQLEGDAIRGTSREALADSCTLYSLSHDIEWTLNATIETPGLIRGTLAGRFTYVGGGEVVALDRVWALELTR